MGHRWARHRRTQAVGVPAMLAIAAQPFGIRVYS